MSNTKWRPVEALSKYVQKYLFTIKSKRVTTMDVEQLYKYIRELELRLTQSEKEKLEWMELLLLTVQKCAELDKQLKAKSGTVLQFSQEQN